MFSNLDQKEMAIVVDAIEEARYVAGDKVIVEGDQGDCMYVLEQGQLACTKVFGGATEPTHLKDYEPGEGFVELALLYNAPRAATITSCGDSVCWRLDRDTFNHIVKDSAQKKREMYDTFLKTVEILQTMDPYERLKLSDAIKSSTYSKDDFIITEGEVDDQFFILSEGSAIATKLIDNQTQQVKDYAVGDYFGERALIMNEARAANIIVTSDKAQVLSLDRKTFKRLLGPLDRILMRNMEAYKKFNN